MYIPFFFEKKSLNIPHRSSISFFMASKSGLSKFKPAIQTRSRNKTSHPGQVVNDTKQKRQSHGEMEKIRADETRLRQEKEEEVAENIQKAADIEDRMRRDCSGFIKPAGRDYGLPGGVGEG